MNASQSKIVKISTVRVSMSMLVGVKKCQRSEFEMMRGARSGEEVKCINVKM